MLKFYKPPGKKKPDNTRINTYTTLADFYIKNGYQKEARSTLEDMARYYESIGHNVEAKKALQLAAQIGSAKNTGHLESSISNNAEQPGGKHRSPQHSNNSEYTGVAGKHDTVNSTSTDRAAGFFDLESALTENDSSVFSSRHVSSGSPLLTQRVKVSPSAHAAIFREIKLSPENNRDEHSLDFHYTMGIAHQQLRQFDDAIEEFTAALADVKNSAARETASGATSGDCYLQLVTCYDALNKQAKAAQYAGKALTLNSLTAKQRLFFKEFIAAAGNNAEERGLCSSLTRQIVQIKSALYRLYSSAIT